MLKNVYARAEEQPTMQQQTNDRPRLLIAEDDAALGDMMVAALEDAFSVDLATDGSDALDKVRAARPDVILLDGKMPRMGGLAACRALRADPATRDLPVLFVTGDDGPESAQAAFAAGASDFLAKPFSLAQLRSRAETLLMRRRAS